MLAMLLTAALLGQMDLKAIGKSLPRLDGEVRVAGLEKPVEITRDSLGIPNVRGESFDDVIRAEGFLHGQERFFEMDALRRVAAGELAALVGPPALASDQHYRLYRFRAVCDDLFRRLPEVHQHMLEIYAAGVNAGLADLAAVPPEYAVTGTKPQPWRAQDALLVQAAMFDVLNFDQRFEAKLGMLKDALAPAVFEFLTPQVTRFDVPLIADEAGGASPIPQLPGADVIDLRNEKPLGIKMRLGDSPWLAAGSNNWAVSKARSTHGGAILASDPHLPLTVPNIWYRAQLEWNTGKVEGVSLPGVPGIISGSNGNVAWGLTNTMGDFQDFIIIETDPADPTRYRTPDGWNLFGEAIEHIEVRGGAPVELKLKTTRWGTVTDTDFSGRPLVLKWTALDPATVNINIVEMMHATKLDDAVDIARNWWGPSQNVLIADNAGRIGWVVSGYLPKRRGFDGKVPMSWADGTCGWDGAIPENQRPMLIDPPSGILYTANNRTIPAKPAAALGHLWDVSFRAARIKQLLEAKPKFSEADLRAIQLDTRNVAYDFYQDLIGTVISSTDTLDADLVNAAMLADHWNGNADVDQVGYRLLRLFRSALRDALIPPLLGAVMAKHPDLKYVWLNDEEPLRQLLEKRPPHLLPQPHATWDDLLRDCLRSAMSEMAKEVPAKGMDATWGDVNIAQIQHPVSMAVPLLAKLLDMPADPLPGDTWTVRVGAKNFGASMRMVVSPGREESGLLHMPCGESGHPLSPHYRDGHSAWVKGLATPFLAGETANTLRLVPAP